MADNSGKSIYAVQTSTAATPKITIIDGVQCLRTDGVDDGMVSYPMSFNSAMDCFMLVRATSSTGVLLYQTENRWIGAWDFGGNSYSSQLSYSGSANACIIVDGEPISWLDRQRLKERIADGQWHVVELHNLTINEWTGIEFAGYPTYAIGGGIGGIILCQAGDRQLREKNRKWLASKANIALKTLPAMWFASLWNNFIFLNNGRTIRATNGGGWYHASFPIARATAAIRYFEITVDEFIRLGGEELAIGLSNENGTYSSDKGGKYQYHASGHTRFNTGEYNVYGQPYFSGDVIGCLVQPHGESQVRVNFSKNGVDQGPLIFNFNQSWRYEPCVSVYNHSSEYVKQISFNETFLFKPANAIAWNA